MARNKTSVIFSADAVAVTVTGSAVGGFNQADRVAAQIVGANKTGSPTLTGKVQSSFDGTNWFDLITFTALTANGSEVKYASEFQGTAVVIGPQLRGVVTVSGTGTMDIDITVFAKG